MDGAAVEEQIIHHLGPPSWVSFIAGTFSGVVGIAVGQPFDVIKVRQQALNYGTMGQTFLRTFRNEGFFAIYKGMVPPMLGSMGVNAVLFFTYDYSCQQLMKRRLGNAEPPKEQMKPTTMEMCIAGWIAGFAQTWAWTPFEAVKIRLQTQLGHTVYKDPVDCAKQMWRQSGIKAFFRGVGVTLWRDVPSFALYFVLYEKLKDSVGVFNAGGIAGMSCWAVIYPLDVIKSRVQTDGLTNRRYSGMIDCAKKSYAEHGYKIFFSGFPATMFRGYFVNAGTFVGYEFCMELYNKFGSKRSLA